MSESASVEADFLLPLVRRCGGSLPVLGRHDHKEGRSDRQGSLRHELDIGNLLANTMREDWSGHLVKDSLYGFKSQFSISPTSARRSLHAAASSRICSHPIPQHPPTMLAPLSIHSFAYSPYWAGFKSCLIPDTTSLA